jgi:LmbE family N-acetylglucosaminyl deacetylase
MHPTLSDRGPTMLGIWAHPDDETYLSGGLMDRVVALGGRVVCVTATRGEAGSTGPDQPPSLAAQREAELRSALGVLGVTDVRLLGHADGRCDEVDPDTAAHDLAEVLAEIRPDLVVTFGPDGITAHPDHVAVGDWATRAWAQVGRGRLLYATHTERFLRQHEQLHRDIGMFMGPPPAGVPDDAVSLRVALDPAELTRKREALARHASQSTGVAAVLGEERYRSWIALETFRRPRPGELHPARHTARRAAMTSGVAA